jgi:hypothetical protein
LGFKLTFSVVANVDAGAWQRAAKSARRRSTSTAASRLRVGTCRHRVLRSSRDYEKMRKRHALSINVPVQLWVEIVPDVVVYLFDWLRKLGCSSGEPCDWLRFPWDTSRDDSSSMRVLHSEERELESECERS